MGIWTSIQKKVITIRFVDISAEPVVTAEISTNRKKRENEKRRRKNRMECRRSDATQNS